MTTAQLNIAVITGGHAYDVINFHKLFRQLNGVNAYIQHLDDFATSSEAICDSYDVLLFYIMMMEGPSDEGMPGFRGRPKRALERLGQTKQGIVVMHHGLLAYPQWPQWNQIVGIADRTLAGYEHDETLHIEVADRTHPITQGMADWTMVDETYDMANAPSDKQILLTVKHANSMSTIAWAHQYGHSRVFCLQLGHDDQAWADQNFRNVLARGLAWSCGRLA